jgi:O-antigen biosynthesis protein WbqP
MSRETNLILAILLSILFSIPALTIAILVRLTSKGPAVHWSNRVGKNNKIFAMPKFRTMKVDSPDVATHLLKEPDKYLTTLGGFLRKTSLDELPQLWSILKGDMDFVGPRPALYNQDDLIKLRTEAGVHKVAPGVTGWAQIQGRDELPIPKKVQMDKFYVENRSIYFDLKILWQTFFVVLKSKGVSH